jgi:hypothetical protein
VSEHSGAIMSTLNSAVVLTAKLAKLLLLWVVLDRTPLALIHCNSKKLYLP